MLRPTLFLAMVAILFSSCRQSSFLQQRYTHFARHTQKVEIYAPEKPLPDKKSDNKHVDPLRTTDNAVTLKEEQPVTVPAIAKPVITQKSIRSVNVSNVVAASGNTLNIPYHFKQIGKTNADRRSNKSGNRILPVDPTFLFFLTDLFFNGGTFDFQSFLLSILLVVIILAIFAVIM
jgi:hypothetical protein